MIKQVQKLPLHAIFQHAKIPASDNPTMENKSKAITSGKAKTIPQDGEQEGQGTNPEVIIPEQNEKLIILTQNYYIDSLWFLFWISLQR